LVNCAVFVIMLCANTFHSCAQVGVWRSRDSCAIRFADDSDLFDGCRDAQIVKERLNLVDDRGVGDELQCAL